MYKNVSRRTIMATHSHPAYPCPICGFPFPNLEAMRTHFAPKIYEQTPIIINVTVNLLNTSAKK